MEPNLIILNTPFPNQNESPEITPHSEKSASISFVVDSLFTLSRAPFERYEASALTPTPNQTTFEQTPFHLPMSLFTSTNKSPAQSQLGVPPFSMIMLPFASPHTHTSEISPFVTLFSFPPGAPIATQKIDVPQTLQDHNATKMAQRNAK